MIKWCDWKILSDATEKNVLKNWNIKQIRKIKHFENKIPNVSGLVTNTDFNKKLNKLKRGS